ncbi:MAG: Tellurite resistance protein TerB [Candidatus Scalindua rubra]|uniref:Tellurite resistance protein TerB n=1 Tax=Candidatus Scalindua rubra TaxID=1872076 RepID=A0A1E3XGM7_9BACT|nr:MAG: Tellurite resistance protein TerB [Candidatus Scalindua rubra]
MAGFLDKFRKNVITSVWKDKIDEPKVKGIDDKIALGVLLWVVAEADEKFLAKEDEKIREILTLYSKISEEEIMTVLASIKEAARERIDLHRFTREVSANLPYDVKISIIETLFRVACCDEELDHKEIEIIRKISGLFQIAHKDFINAKITIKKEFGLDTTK